MCPSVTHLVISLAPGGLERLVVDWTNARNRKNPGSTCIVCLDELGALSTQVENGTVQCIGAKRSRFPWDRAAVRSILDLLGARRSALGTPCSALGALPSALHAPPVIHAHNLAAWQYGVLAKLSWKTIDHRPQITTGENIAQKAAKPTKPIRQAQGREDGDSPRRHGDTEAGEGEKENGSRSLQMAGTPFGKITNHLPEEIPRERGDASVLKTSHWFSSLSRSLRVSVVKSSSRSSRASVQTSSLVRLVYTQHGANVHNMSLVNRLKARLLACFTDEIVAVSEATADVMARTLWLPRRRIKVVVNGVAESQKSEVRSQKSEVRTKYAIPDGAFVIGSVGRLAHVKGYDRLIAAFAAVIGYSLSVIGEKAKGDPSTNNQEPITNNGAAGAYLLLVGDGPERATLERQARDLGVADRVLFAGFQSNPEPYYSVMDLFILSSRSEGLSISLLEAMAGGVPVAVTDVGANRDVIADGQCGVVLPDDEADWPAILASIWQNTGDLLDKVPAARERVREHYSLDATLRGYEALYHGEQSSLAVSKRIKENAL